MKCPLPDCTCVIRPDEWEEHLQLHEIESALVTLPPSSISHFFFDSIPIRSAFFPFDKGEPISSRVANPSLPHAHVDVRWRMMWAYILRAAPGRKGTTRQARGQRL
jgi:hypothetical protein